MFGCENPDEKPVGPADCLNLENWWAMDGPIFAIIGYN